MTLNPLPPMQRLLLAYDRAPRWSLLSSKLGQLAVVALLFVWASFELHLATSTPRYLQYLVAGSLQVIGGLYCLWLIIKKWRSHESMGSTFGFVSFGSLCLGKIVGTLGQVPFAEWRWGDGLMLCLSLTLLQAQFSMWRRDRLRDLTSETKQFEQEDHV